MDDEAMLTELLATVDRHMDAKEYQSALDVLHVAARLAPGDPRVELGQTLAGLAAREEAAAKRMAAQLAVDPGDVAAMIKMADSLRRNGKYDEALAVVRRAVETAPDDPTTHFELGLTVHCWGKAHAEAIGHYDRALALDPRHRKALQYRAIAAREAGDPEEALATYARLEALAPARFDQHENRAMAYLAAGRWASAEADLTHALARKDGRFYRTRRGLARLEQGNLAGAVEDFDRSIELSAADALKWHDPEEDGDLVDLNPDPEALLGRGRARIVLGDLAGARADLAEAAHRFAAGGEQDQAAAARALLAELPS